MNWKEIKDKYLKAYSLYVEYTCTLTQLDNNNRDVFDFFDNNRVYISVSNQKYNLGFGYFIITKNQKQAWWNEFYETRKEAEQAAFNKAFEILNNKLK